MGPRPRFWSARLIGYAVADPLSAHWRHRRPAVDRSFVSDETNAKANMEAEYGGVFGKVKSENAACKDARHVSLYRRGTDGSRQRLGVFVTGPSGKWHITVSGFAGVSLSHFYAKVRRRAEGTAGTIFVCKSADSETTAFEE